MEKWKRIKLQGDLLGAAISEAGGAAIVRLVVLAVIFLPGCKEYNKNRSHANVPDASIRKGEKLALLYCQSCHLLPDPALLDTKSWEKGVLPGMGPRLGIFSHGLDRYPSNLFDTNLPKGFYPSRPLLSQDEWQHIVDYFTALSPDSLPKQSHPRGVRSGLSLFEIRTPLFHLGTATTSLTKIDSSDDGRYLWVFDIQAGNYYRWNATLDKVDSIRSTGAVVDLVREGGEVLACNIGLLTPNNGKYGQVQRVVAGRGAGTGMVPVPRFVTGPVTGPVTGSVTGSAAFGNAGMGHPIAAAIRLDSVPLAGRLARPVQLAPADLNQDGRPDLVVCEFGNLTGALSWLENKGAGHYERHVLKAVPGAVRSVITDYDHDGRPDILVLFAQGDEGIFLFTNQGGGRFRERPLLRFPPMYGSSYFELADMNGDGLPDIVYTCGDNADLSPVLKPYHGVYVYLNDGKGGFAKRYFWPMHGCYKAMARDFDGDGDPDIAAISFFADYDHQPEEGFVYLENLGGLDFQPYSIPETQAGKWLTMDAGDLDGDGRIDLVLGNFSFFSPVTKGGVDFSKGPGVMVLRNRGK